MDEIINTNGILQSIQQNVAVYSGELTLDVFNTTVKRMENDMSNFKHSIYPDIELNVGRIKTIKVNETVIKTFGFYESVTLDLFRHVFANLQGKNPNITVYSSVKFLHLFYEFMFEFTYKAFSKTNTLFLDGYYLTFIPCIMFNLNDEELKCAALFNSDTMSKVLMKELDINAKN